MFQYLLRLKRTQMELEKSWASVMQQGHLDFEKSHSERVKGKTSQHKRHRVRPMWWVREQMVFLIRNLQFYIQVNVNFNYKYYHLYLLLCVIGMYVFIIRWM